MRGSALELEPPEVKRPASKVKDNWEKVGLSGAGRVGVLPVAAVDGGGATAPLAFMAMCAAAVPSKQVSCATVD